MRNLLVLLIVSTIGCSLDQSGLGNALPGITDDADLQGADGGQENPREAGSETISTEVLPDIDPADRVAPDAGGEDVFAGSCQPTVKWITPTDRAAVSRSGFVMTANATSPVGCGRSLLGMSFRAAWLSGSIAVLGAGPSYTAMAPAWSGGAIPSGAIIATITDSSGATGMAIIHVALD